MFGKERAFKVEDDPYVNNEDEGYNSIRGTADFGDDKFLLSLVLCMVEFGARR